ncbi:hypothetical protein HBH70_250320 [Parastagonospora nodorum]|nr:hypothetical protein HBH70_250320 [Parastagonospora nodorum]
MLIKTTAPPALIKQLFYISRCSNHRYLFNARRLLKLLEEILLIATRICYCVTLCYLVCKHSCLLAYRPLIYIRIVPRDRYNVTDVILREEVLLGFDGVKGDMTRSSKVKMFNNSCNDGNSDSNAKI